MIRIWLVLLVAIVSCTGCKQEASTAPEKNTMENAMDPTNDDPNAPGIRDEVFVSDIGVIARYTISIPEGYNPAKPTPLIVALHYGGTVTPHYARGIVKALIVPGLSELNAIVVAPDSVTGPWNNDSNEKVILEVMDLIENQYNIDKTKTLLTGFSMGGHGTWYIGSRNQGRFSAMIPIASSPIVKEDVEWSTPVYAIHSRSDTVVPIAASEKYVTEQIESGSKTMVFAVVEDLSHFKTGSFSVPLKAAVPWVEAIWNGETVESGKRKEPSPSKSPE